VETPLPSNISTWPYDILRVELVHTGGGNAPAFKQPRMPLQLNARPCYARQCYGWLAVCPPPGLRCIDDTGDLGHLAAPLTDVMGVQEGNELNEGALPTWNTMGSAPPEPRRPWNHVTVLI
jgi:hypothetical protein